MSDPMTNTEVEDVLASIRRLVSDDKRPEPKSVDDAVTDRLVLTPSLRVMDKDSLGAPDPDMPAKMESQDEPAQLDTADVTEDFPDKALKINENSEDAAAESPLEDAAAQVEVIADTPAVQEDHANVHEHQFVDAKDEPADATTPDGPAEFDNDAARATSLEQTADLDDADSQDMPPMSDEGADTHADMGVKSLAEAPNDSAIVDDLTVDDTPFAADAGGETPSNAAAQTLSEKVAALETLVGKRGDNFEPDDLNVGANAGSEPPAMEWEDVDPLSDGATDPVLDAELVDVDPISTSSTPFTDTFMDEALSEDADVSADDAPAYAAFVGAHAKAAPDDADAPMFSEEEDLLDEETLRELVSEIVREELQGALGERITRNVRKLVRREIHRAMAAQDLD